MGANPGRRDAWPPFKRLRHVLVRRRRYGRPAQGLVLDWAKHGRTWMALVVYVDDDAAGGGAQLEWIAPGELVPLNVDPNTAEVLPAIDARRAKRGPLSLEDPGDY